MNRLKREAINQLKKYTLGKKDTEKTEISVSVLNRIIFALELEPKMGDIEDEEVKEAIKTLDNHCKQYDNDCINDEGELCPFSELFADHKHCSFLYRVPNYWCEEILKERKNE